ncbi:uncharacterized protein LOC105253276 isoform X1 [Camponotus floridanus]|nr:uncharacterized protein LOC105253276 isoform X1 [Camponotus floridanus]
MATTGSNANAGNEAANGSSNVPQWKRDLIQRRRQQSKVLANNGASVKLCSAVIGTSASADGVVEQNAPSVQEHCSVAGTLRMAQRLTTTSSEDTGTTVAVCGGGGGGGGGGGIGDNASGALLSPPSSYSARRPPISGAAGGAAATAADFASVAYNMRLEADLSLCSDAEDVVNGAPTKFAMDERKFSDYAGDENEEAARAIARMGNEGNEAPQRAVVTGRGKDALGGNARTLKELPPTSDRRHVSGEDAESDSSEELQYGPGIVNKLKSKYLNLTLRETTKSRASVQRFRRAASLEDLLDRDDDEASGHEKQPAIGRRYAKREAGSTSGDGVVAPKTDRYRNATRGNDSMKRARSVETLMRYNSVTTDEPIMRQLVPVARPATNGVRQEPVNDHIILVDRTSVKIESRLGELERPKPVNKPKRIKPVLAETERPPPDLVKTTMRIFESSAKKVKPKGEVAAKVATFKTINDTFKAQKKLMPKPPIQPKPFVNGGARPGSGGLGSPKKIMLHKPTAKLIETQDGKEEYRIDGIITEPIAQSVSSVVSKFQQIEKSHSPSPSPEPSCYKFKFSPANSPEPPQMCKQMPKSVALEIVVKSPPVTPVLSPRIPSPRLQSPPSPIKDVRQGSQSPSSPVKDSIRIQILNPFHKPPLPSPVREPSKTSEPESFQVPRSQIEEPSRTNVESPESPIKAERKEDAKSSRVTSNDDEEEEVVDGPRTISKLALDNIGRAGITMQFNFGDKSVTDKSYLPGVKQNGQRSEDDRCAKTESRNKTIVPSDAPAGLVMTSETTYRLQERLGSEKLDDKEDELKLIEEKLIVPESKPIGAICSLGLIKTATTTTAYPQSNNEAKTIRCQQKSEFSLPQKQIGIIRPLVSTQKTQHPQQNLSNRELEKNLINRVKSIEQPTKVVVSLKSADEIQPTKKTNAGGGGGLWDTKPWNQQNNTMVFNFSNRKDVPDYIENDGLIIRRKREKPKVGDGGIIVLDATLDASTTDDAEWEISGGPPSPCDVSFLNDNVLINGRSNLSRTPRNHKHRIQFDDTATRTFEYPSESSILEGETSSVDGETSGSIEQQSTTGNNKTSTTSSTTTSMPSLLDGGGLASYTPSKVDLTSEGFELGITRAIPMVVSASAATGQTENKSDVECLRPAQDAGAWGSETTGDLLY